MAHLLFEVSYWNFLVVAVDVVVAVPVNDDVILVVVAYVTVVLVADVVIADVVIAAVVVGAVNA